MRNLTNSNFTIWIQNVLKDKKLKSILNQNHIKSDKIKRVYEEDYFLGHKAILIIMDYKNVGPEFIKELTKDDARARFEYWDIIEPNTDLHLLGEVIKTIMVEKNIKQKELVAQMKISQPSLNRALSRNYLMSYERLANISKVLGVTPGYVLDCLINKDGLNESNEITKTLIKARETKGYTKKDVAYLMKISENYYNKLEQGQVMFGSRCIETLCRVLEINKANVIKELEAVNLYNDDIKLLYSRQTFTTKGYVGRLCRIILGYESILYNDYIIDAQSALTVFLLKLMIFLSEKNGVSKFDNDLTDAFEVLAEEMDVDELNGYWKKFSHYSPTFNAILKNLPIKEARTIKYISMYVNKTKDEFSIEKMGTLEYSTLTKLIETSKSFKDKNRVVESKEIISLWEETLNYCYNNS